MFKILDFTKDEVIAMLVDGKITREDYSHLTPMLEKAQREHESLKFYVEVRSIEGIEAAALWEDFKMYARFVKPSDKLAIVADGGLWRTLSKISQPFVKGVVKHFELAAALQAREWLINEE